LPVTVRLFRLLFLGTEPVLRTARVRTAPVVRTRDEPGRRAGP